MISFLLIKNYVSYYSYILLTSSKNIHNTITISITIVEFLFKIKYWTSK